MAKDSSSAPARTIFLLHGEDPFRTRLRLVELVGALLAGTATTAGDLSSRPLTAFSSALGVSRHDARQESAAALAMSGRSQGLFDALADERRVVVVEHAEALKDTSVIAEFPGDAALVLVSGEKLAAGRARRGARAPKGVVAGAPDTLVEAVESAGGVVERIEKLAPDAMTRWIEARARLHGVQLAPDALFALSSLGSDSERVEHELGKLRSFSGGAVVSGADVRSLVAGAIEADVFALTEAVVRHDPKTAIARLEALLADGQAVQQILALLVWQFRVLLFASASRSNEDSVRMAKAIRSSPGAIGRWTAYARRVVRADVVRAYEVLYATDMAIKQGRVESETAALMLCVLDLCGVHAADPRELVVGEPPRR